MSIINTQVTVYKLEYQCDACKQANVAYIIIESNVEKNTFTHTCPNCKENVELNSIYPQIIYQ